MTPFYEPLVRFILLAAASRWGWSESANSSAFVIATLCRRLHTRQSEGRFDSVRSLAHLLITNQPTNFPMRGLPSPLTGAHMWPPSAVLMAEFTIDTDRGSGTVLSSTSWVVATLVGTTTDTDGGWLCALS